MSNYSCDFVRRLYGVPAEIGRRVIANGEPGVIMADRGHYIGVILDNDPKKRIRNYHPTWEMQYGEMADTLPLKEWLVLPFEHDWEDLNWSREAREDLVRVWAATRSQAKYKAYERLQDYCHSIKAMLHFKIRRA
ncbi:hypothetical protein [Pseudomonas protegens]|uniref:hypothetical protein n=1 Tax=Pseudomonas protegens TaxID=380021 RepID=UPI00069D5E4F|nr:hypothetical protein [Pseudomonas protegens]